MLKGYMMVNMLLQNKTIIIESNKEVIYGIQIMESSINHELDLEKFLVKSQHKLFVLRI